MQNYKCPKASGAMIVKVEGEGGKRVYCFSDSAKHKLLTMGRRRIRMDLAFWNGGGGGGSFSTVE